MKPQLFYGYKPEKEKMKEISNSSLGSKANGGLWTSTYENGKSEWVQWCENAQFFTTDSDDGWLLIPNENSRILTVDNENDFANIYKEYGTHTDYNFPILDFEKMSRDYDGLHLTSEGQWETRWSFPYNLHGWDCESTFWFRWCFDEVKYIGEIKIEICNET